MTEFMTISQVVDAARSDVTNKVSRGLFKGAQGTTNDNEENIYTIESLYSQWAENPSVASKAIIKMLKEEFSNLL